MEITKTQILNYINECDDLKILVSILELSAHKSGVLTVSEMARQEGKSANGVRESKKYPKVTIGTQLMCLKGYYDDNLPF